MKQESNLSVSNIEKEEDVKRKRKFHVVAIYAWIATFVSCVIYGSFILIPALALWSHFGFIKLAYVSLALFIFLVCIATVVVCFNIEKNRRFVRTSVTTFHFIIAGIPLFVITLGILYRLIPPMIRRLDRMYFNVYDSLYPSDITIGITMEEALQVMESSYNIVKLKNLKRESKILSSSKQLRDYRKISDACDLKIRILKIEMKANNNLEVCIKDPIYVMLKENYNEFIQEIQIIESI